MLTVLVPWGVQQYASGTAQAVLDHAPAGARLVFSCGWHITRDGQDRYSRTFLTVVKAAAWLARLACLAELDDQVEACRRIFASDRAWTVVRGSDLEEGASQGLPVWSRHVGDSVLVSNLTRRVDFALFMVEALTDPALIHEAPAIVGCQALGDPVRRRSRQSSADKCARVVRTALQGLGRAEPAVMIGAPPTQRVALATSGRAQRPMPRM